MKVPQVSFVLTVHNGWPDIVLALDSILQQNGPDFEVIVIDDGSTDGTTEYLQTIKDTRLKVFINLTKLGIGYATNLGISQSQSLLICKLDADDICLRGRLKSQFNFMERRPHISVLGTSMRVFGSHQAIWRMPLRDVDIKARMIFRNPILNSSVMMRRDHLPQEPYNTTSKIEDYDLWMSLWKTHQFANLSGTYVAHKLHRSSHTNTFDPNEIHKGFFQKWLPILGIPVTHSEVETHLALAGFYKQSISLKREDVDLWMDKLDDCISTRYPKVHRALAAEMKMRKGALDRAGLLL